jgi:competence protein CoiA
VEIEWKVEETNQRADVIVIHPSGERWAFEFQCSSISETIWRERHVYKAAGVKDFWILNIHFNDWTANGRPNIYLKRELERAIFNEYHYVAYLATPYEKDGCNEEFMFNLLRGGELEKTITIGSDYLSGPLYSIQIIDEHYWNNEMFNYYSKYNRIKKLINIPSLYGLVMDYIKEKERQEEDKKRVKYNDYYKHLLEQRNGAFNSLTFKEKELFLKLCKKHGFSFKTLPGILMTEGPNAYGCI